MTEDFGPFDPFDDDEFGEDAQPLPPRKLQPLRSPRRIAMIDQVYALLRDVAVPLTAEEVADRLHSNRARVHYQDAFSLLDRLWEEERIEKWSHPLLRNVLWSVPGVPGRIEQLYVHAIEQRDRLRAVLASAPAPPAGEEYAEWWNGPRALEVD